MKLPFISAPSEITNENYHNSDDFKEFCSSSMLKLMLVSPKHARYALDHPEENKETEAKSQGSVYHSMLASLTNKGDLSDFENEFFIFNPPINPRTKEPFGFGTKAYTEAVECEIDSNQGKEPCSEGQKQIAESMIDELMNGNPHLSPTICHMIKIGSAEQSHFLEYQGQKFKYRTDLKTAKKIVDWKKTRLGFPKPEMFNKEIVKWNYHISAAMYQFLEFVLTGTWKTYFWVAQEDQPPFDFVIHDSSEWTYNIDHSDGAVEMMPGAMHFQKLIDYWILCSERKQWPGYSIFLQPDWKGQRIAYPEIPGYFFKNDFEFFDK